MSEKELKKYRNVDEQIEYLYKSKKIINDFSDNRWLKEVNYITLINPFKEIFAAGIDGKGNHIYKNETKVQHFVSLLQLDGQFSDCLFWAIRDFERKLKTLVITEMCEAYACNEDGDEKDETCTSYVQDISSFLYAYTNSDNTELSEILLPCFCPNIFTNITKKGTNLRTDRERKFLKENVGVLERILTLGTGKTKDGEIDRPKNILIRHYLDEYEVCPLWIIPNGLTLGEVISLYKMLSFESQDKIMKEFGETFKVPDDSGKYNYKAFIKFSGWLESIRLLRNTINHYEPVFPVLMNGCSRISDIRSNRYLASLKLLFPGYAQPEISSDLTSRLDYITPSHYNLVKIKMLDIMDDIVVKYKNGPN